MTDIVEQRVAILDLDSIAFAIGNPNKYLDDNKEPILDEKGRFTYYPKTELELIASAESIMNGILTDCNCTHYANYIKGKGNHRYALNSEYKANRPKESPSWWKFVKEYLISNWNAVEVNGIEVDDACRIATHYFSDPLIVAIDQDLLSLPGNTYNWKKKEFKNNTEHEYQYKFWADMIIGQPSDNIKGLPGKGKVYAQKLLDNCGMLHFTEVVLTEYIKEYGEFKGISEFYRNYNSLYILSINEVTVEISMKLSVPHCTEFKRKEINEINGVPGAGQEDMP